jgi:hypothetical protein
VAHYATKSGSPQGIVFSNRFREPYSWPDNDITDSNADIMMAPYPDLRADIPGVQMSRPTDPSSPAPLQHDDPNWAQMADDALANADIDNSEVLPPPPDVVIIDDDDDVPLPPGTKQTLDYLPKLEPETPPPSSLSCYPPCARRPPPRFGFDEYHQFNTVADDVHTSFPYIDASGATVDLALTNESHITHGCHFVMLHCAESTFIGNPNNTRQYGLKTGLKKIY